MKCVCFDRELSEIVKLAMKNDWSIEETVDNTGCGTRCGLCVKLIEDYLAWERKVEKDFIKMYDELRDEERGTSR